MFGRKRSSKGGRSGQKKKSKAKKAVKRLLDKPGPERMVDVANLAVLENLQPFEVGWCLLLLLLVVVVVLFWLFLPLVLCALHGRASSLSRFDGKE